MVSRLQSEEEKLQRALVDLARFKKSYIHRRILSRQSKDQTAPPEQRAKTLKIGLACTSETGTLFPLGPTLSSLVSEWGSVERWWRDVVAEVDLPASKPCPLCSYRHRQGEMKVSLGKEGNPSRVFLLIFMGHGTDSLDEMKGETLLVAEIIDEGRSLNSLEQSESRLVALMSSLDSGMLLEDETGSILLINREFCRLFRLQGPPEALLGTVGSRVVEGTRHHFKVPEAFVSGVESLVAARKPRTGEELLCSDGRTLERGYFPIFDGTVFRGQIWQYRDISQLKRAEGRWWVSEQVYKDLFRFSGEGIFLHTPAGKILDANPKMVELLGIPHERLLEIPVADLHPRSATQLREDGLRELRRTGFVRLDIPFQRGDGSIFVAELSATLTERSGGSLVQVIVKDVTERRRSEEQIEQLSLVASKTSKGVLITNAQGKTEWANEGFTALSGYSLGEMLGRSPGSILRGPETDTQTTDRIDAALRRKEGSSEEILNYRKDGSQYWVGLNITPVLNEEGDVTQFVCIQDDITERRHQQMMLRQAKDQAEAANQAKDDFLATMSHEMRTPLNVILGNLELVRDGELAEGQEQAARTAQKGAESLLFLIEDLLGFSEIESGKIEVVRESFDFSSLVHDVLSGFEIRAQEQGVRLRAEFLEPFPKRWIGDRQRIRQIIMNLVGNAVKFTEHGVVTVKVGKKVGDEGGWSEGLILTVEDSGIGIEEELQELIFQKFFRVDGSRTRSSGGTGLGLSISRSLARLLGGDIRVSSVLGEGSRFEVFLPMATDSGFQAPHREEVPAGLSWNQAVGLRALLIEDSADNRRLTTHFLERAGFRVLRAKNGQEGVEVTRAAVPDFILMDIEMPVMDGFQATREIRNWERRHGRGPIPILALTAHALPGVRDACLAGGFTDVLTKPFSSGTLLSAISSLLEGSVKEGDSRLKLQPPPSAPRRDVAFVDPDILHLRPSFLRSCERMNRDLLSQIDRLDFDAIRRAGHNLKGNGEVYGFPMLSRIGGMVERAALEENSESLRRLAAALQDFLEGLRRSELEAGEGAEGQTDCQ